MASKNSDPMGSEAHKVNKGTDQVTERSRKRVDRLRSEGLTFVKTPMAVTPLSAGIVVGMTSVAALLFGSHLDEGLKWLMTQTDYRESGSTTLRNVGLVVGGFVAIVVAIWRGSVADRQARASMEQVLALESQVQLTANSVQSSLLQVQISRHQLMNESYLKGTEMLGSKVMAVRLGGIFALHRLGKDDPEEYHVQTMRLLSSFVRYPTEEARSAEREDVRVALAVIGTRSDTEIALERKEGYRVSLVSADLSNMILIAPNLTGANLIGANLTNSILGRANLTDVQLFDANMTRTDLSRTKGLTQDQLDQACADSEDPPKLDGALDVKTGAPLQWRGKA